jgi:hypothetical protein
MSACWGGPEVADRRHNDANDPERSAPKQTRMFPNWSKITMRS